MSLTLMRLIDSLFSVLHILIIARIILGFFRVSPYSNKTLWEIVQFIHRITEPIMAPFRNIIPMVPMGGGFLDFSPIIILLLLPFVEQLLKKIILLIF